MYQTIMPKGRRFCRYRSPNTVVRKETRQLLRRMLEVYVISKQYTKVDIHSQKIISKGFPGIKAIQHYYLSSIVISHT